MKNTFGKDGGKGQRGRVNILATFYFHVIENLLVSSSSSAANINNSIIIFPEKDGTIFFPLKMKSNFYILTVQMRRTMDGCLEKT